MLKTGLGIRSLFLLLLALNIVFNWSIAQGSMKPVKGYSEQIGLMVFMLEDLRLRITDQVKDLNLTETDYLYDGDANSIGALIMHLISTEVYYQTETLTPTEWSAEELRLLGMAGELNEKTKKSLTGKPIHYYLDLWEKVRARSLDGLKEKDDAWFLSEIDEGINYQYVWYHVMEHSANHMGQIARIKNSLPK